jgi:hypothetical protein
MKMELERNEEGFSIDASSLGELLKVPPSRILAMIRANEITSVCERGEGEHEGQYRLTFLYKGLRAQLTVDESGQVTRRSVIDLGDRPVAQSRSVGLAG